MRSPDGQVLVGGCFQQSRLPAHSVAQNPIDERPLPPVCELDGFVNGGVLWSLEKKQLVESQSQQVAGTVVDMAGSKVADPKIEQSQVAKHTVEKFGDKRAIGRGELGSSENLAQDRIGKFSSASPLLQSGESEPA